MSDVTNLKQAENKVECTGYLAEKDIHPVKDSNGRDALEGYVSIKTDDTNQIRFNIRVLAKKNDGTPNPAYENISKFNDDAKSIAEVGAEAASKVEVRAGQLNPYHSTQSNSDVLGYRTSFIGVVRSENFEPKAQATVELFVQNVLPEMDKNGEETGRALVKGVLVTYNGVEPLTLTVGKDMADEVLSGAIETGQTFEFFADIVNSRVEKKKEIPVRLGKPRIERTFIYTNELILTGCSEPYDDDRAYDRDAIKLALNERNDRIKANANKPKGNAGGQSKPSGAASGRVATW